MAHWAEIDSDNIVIRVLVMDNDTDNDEGFSWLTNTLGGTWVQTSYNTRGGVHLLDGTPLRKNYAGTGMTYDSVRDAFIYPKCHDEAILNEETCLWDCSNAAHEYEDN
jgi:hypothetical protein